MSFTADAVAKILQQRYDYLAARVVLKAAANKKGLKAEGPYSKADLEAIADYVATTGYRVDAVVEALKTADGKAAAKAPQKPAAKADEKPAEAEQPAEAKPEAKADETPAETPAETSDEGADEGADEGDDGEDEAEGASGNKPAGNRRSRGRNRKGGAK